MKVEVKISIDKGRRYKRHRTLATVYLNTNRDLEDLTQAIIRVTTRIKERQG